jgi:hypothetical protein
VRVAVGRAVGAGDHCGGPSNGPVRSGAGTDVDGLRTKAIIATPMRTPAIRMSHPFFIWPFFSSLHARPATAGELRAVAGFAARAGASPLSCGYQILVPDSWLLVLGLTRDASQMLIQTHMQLQMQKHGSVPARLGRVTALRGDLRGVLALFLEDLEDEAAVSAPGEERADVLPAGFDLARR